MKNATIKLMSIAVFALLIASCSNADKDRIARLEGKIAELESKNNTRPATTSSTNATNAAQPEVTPEGPLPAFKFNKEVHDFGKIKEGDVVEFEFTFANTGDAPLIIASAQGSCGCTVPEWPKEPIGIGESASIKVKFDSKKKTGIQNKTVTLTANTFPKQTKLQIKANVEAAAKQPS